jgi:hypothetical protein
MPRTAFLKQVPSLAAVIRQPAVRQHQVRMVNDFLKDYLARRK